MNLPKININEPKMELHHYVKRPKICVVGVGGLGCKVVGVLCKMDIAHGVELIAINTDKKALDDMVKEDKMPITSVLIGRRLTKGLGAGGFPDVGEKAAEESFDLLQQVIGRPQLVFLAAGMGGGTGTGASPVIAKIAKDLGAIVICVVTYPFCLERIRAEKARVGIENLRQFSHTVIIINNDSLVRYMPNLSINERFEIANEIIGKAIYEITYSICVPSLTNLDFMDLWTMMKIGGIATISIGWGEGSRKIDDAIATVKNQPLLDIDYKDVKGALTYIIGGSTLSLTDINRVGDMLTEHLNPDVPFVWGARIDEKKGDEVEIISIWLLDKQHIIRKKKN